MKRFLPLFLFVFLISPLSYAQVPNTAPNTFADVVDDLLPAVVNISTTQKVIQPRDFPDMPQFPEGSPFEFFFEDFMNQRRLGPSIKPSTSLGSGFVIDAENGYIVTNNHVIKDADEVRVTFQDDVTIDAEVIGTDDKTDLAVLKVDTKRDLTAVQFGDSDGLRVGDWIVAIGNPFGLGGTVTAGIVSARQRDIQSGPYDDYIQTDASINRGNSGGPMFNLNGDVIGINTAIYSPSGGSVGIGFAIPSALAKPVVDQIIQYGHTRRGWLGVRIQKVTDDIAESLGLDKAQGALIASVNTDGPADKAGIQAGDIITKFDNEPIDDMRDLPRLVAAAPINTNTPITVWREGKEKTLSVTLGELEKAEETGALATLPKTEVSGTHIESLGLYVSGINDEMRALYGFDPSVRGVVITNVDPDSEAVEKGLQEGDVIVEINQQRINAPDDVSDIVRRAERNGRNKVLLFVDRDGAMQFIALKIGD
jgi:serine protease Do